MPTPFEKSFIDNESVDVIVSFHVIEHIHNPKKFILKAQNILKKGGVLVLETPTYDSFLFKLLKHRERSMKCDGHVYFFTKETLRELVESCNFRVIKHETVGRTLSLERLFHNFGIITGQDTFFNFISKMMRLEKIILHLNMHDMQRIYCEKI